MISNNHDSEISEISSTATTPFTIAARSITSSEQRAQWSGPKFRTIGPDQSNRPLAQTGLMVFLMVLDRSSYADGLVWTNGPNGSGVEFEW